MKGNEGRTLRTHTKKNVNSRQSRHSSGGINRGRRADEKKRKKGGRVKEHKGEALGVSRGRKADEGRRKHIFEW